MKNLYRIKSVLLLAGLFFSLIIISTSSCKCSKYTGNPHAEILLITSSNKLLEDNQTEVIVSIRSKSPIVNDKDYKLQITLVKGNATASFKVYEDQHEGKTETFCFNEINNCKSKLNQPFSQFIGNHRQSLPNISKREIAIAYNFHRPLNTQQVEILFELFKTDDDSKPISSQKVIWHPIKAKDLSNTITSVSTSIPAAGLSLEKGPSPQGKSINGDQVKTPRISSQSNKNTSTQSVIPTSSSQRIKSSSLNSIENHTVTPNETIPLAQSATASICFTTQPQNNQGASVRTPSTPIENQKNSIIASTLLLDTLIHRTPSLAKEAEQKKAHIEQEKLRLEQKKLEQKQKLKLEQEKLEQEKLEQEQKLKLEQKKLEQEQKLKLEQKKLEQKKLEQKLKLEQKQKLKLEQKQKLKLEQKQKLKLEQEQKLKLEQEKREQEKEEEKTRVAVEVTDQETPHSITNNTQQRATSINKTSILMKEPISQPIPTPADSTVTTTPAVSPPLLTSTKPSTPVSSPIKMQGEQEKIPPTPKKSSIPISQGDQQTSQTLNSKVNNLPLGQGKKSFFFRSVVNFLPFGNLQGTPWCSNPPDLEKSTPRSIPIQPNVNAPEKIQLTIQRLFSELNEENTRLLTSELYIKNLNENQIVTCLNSKFLSDEEIVNLAQALFEKTKAKTINQALEKITALFSIEKYIDFMDEYQIQEILKEGKLNEEQKDIFIERLLTQFEAKEFITTLNQEHLSLLFNKHSQFLKKTHLLELLKGNTPTLQQRKVLNQRLDEINNEELLNLNFNTLDEDELHELLKEDNCAQQQRDTLLETLFKNFEAKEFLVNLKPEDLSKIITSHKDSLKKTHIDILITRTDLTTQIIDALDKCKSLTSDQKNSLDNKRYKVAISTEAKKTT